MKITLKNLHEATEQEVFDQVASHMLTQNERCESSDGQCLYRNGKGLSCAAGSLIADDEYSEDMEGIPWTSLACHGDFTEDHSDLISSLQLLHDSSPPTQWVRLLYEIAHEYNLEPSVVRDAKNVQH